MMNDEVQPPATEERAPELKMPRHTSFRGIYSSTQQPETEEAPGLLSLTGLRDVQSRHAGTLDAHIRRIEQLERALYHSILNSTPKHTHCEEVHEFVERVGDSILEREMQATCRLRERELMQMHRERLRPESAAPVTGEADAAKADAAGPYKTQCFDGRERERMLKELQEINRMGGIKHGSR